MRVVIFWIMCHLSLGHEKKALLKGKVEICIYVYNKLNKFTLK